MGFLLTGVLFAGPILAKKNIGNAEDILTREVAPKTGVSTDDLGTQVGTLIQGALRITGIAFLVLMVYGGFTWMTARGNETEIEKAKETIIAAIIGLIVVVGSYAITNFVGQRLIQPQASGGAGDTGGSNEPAGTPEGCCEFKVNEAGTWTAFMMTENACKASCKEALGAANCAADDYIWTEGMGVVECNQRRADGFR